MTDIATNTQPPAPVGQPAKKYTYFYLTMLILSTIGTSFGVFELFEIPKAIGYLRTDTVYAVASLVSVLIAFPLAVVALVLLWLKHRLGIWLKLTAYALSIIVALVSLFTAKNVLDNEVAIELSKENANSGIPAETINMFISGAFYAATIVTILSMIAFAILWWFAYRGQVKADTALDVTNR